MFCGSAGGQFLAPYVVYKGGNLWSSWCQNGPSKCRYNVTNRGWFDFGTFEDRFKTVFLPAAIKIDGKKILLGDNLSSHISTDVINICREQNISFICLPPNSTHILQPLDVGVYGPMKAWWKKLLRQYKDENPSVKVMNKTQFPSYLKNLLEKMDAQRLLAPAFERCGIFPVNVNKVLERLPSVETSIQAGPLLNESLIKSDAMDEVAAVAVKVAVEDVVEAEEGGLRQDAHTRLLSLHLRSQIPVTMISLTLKPGPVPMKSLMTLQCLVIKTMKCQ